MAIAVSELSHMYAQDQTLHADIMIVISTADGWISEHAQRLDRTIPGSSNKSLDHMS